MAITSKNSSIKSTNPLTNSADGVIIIDKPSEWTSHDVVAKVRNLLKVKKVGHTGTLDPFATGVLPLTIGKATRLTNYFISSDKTYRGIMRFGFATSTYLAILDHFLKETAPSGPTNNGPGTWPKSTAAPTQPDE